MDLSREWIDPKLPVALDAADLAKLYGWFLVLFPPNSIALSAGFHALSREEQALHWQQRVLNELAARGTAEAVDKLRRLVAAYPADVGVRRAYLQSLEAHRYDQGAPTTLPMLLALLADSRRRYVRNTAQLQVLVLEALDEVQRTMQSQTPQAIFLWNYYHDGTTDIWRPKVENDLSDYIAGQLRLRLEESGIVIGREIEIARTSPQGIGDRVDLLVTATASASSGPGVDGYCAIVIEVKGCWNAGLMSSMNAQLALDYLSTVGTNHGIYLVGWYPLDQWDEQDSRTKSVPRLTPDAMRQQLQQQADGLRNEFSVVVQPFILDARRRPKAARR